MSSNIKRHNHLYNIYNTIQPDSIIALDNHPASYFIINLLNDKQVNVSVVTYSTDILKYLCKNTNFNIVFTSGKIDSGLHTITGAEVIKKFEQLQIDYYFCGANYLDDDANLYQIHEDIAQIQRCLITRSKASYLINYPALCNDDHSQKLSLIGQLV